MHQNGSNQANISTLVYITKYSFCDSCHRAGAATSIRSSVVHECPNSSHKRTAKNHGSIQPTKVTIRPWLHHSLLRILPTVTQFQRIAFCTSLAVINAPHVSFWCETQHNSAEPYQKLQTKLLAWLRGELKSEANLLRFHEAFCDWRDAQPEDDSLAWRLLQFCCAALHSACETLFDP